MGGEGVCPLRVYVILIFFLTHFGPSQPVPLCTTGTHLPHRMGSLTQCPVTFVFHHRSLPNRTRMPTI